MGFWEKSNGCYAKLGLRNVSGSGIYWTTNGR